MLLLACFPPLVLAQQTERTWNDYFQLEQVELLVDQARQALRNGRYPEAEALLEQSLQINRATIGLHNPSQLALVDQLLEALLVQGKWDEFEQKLDYTAWLNRKINANDPQALANGLLRQSDWHRAAAGVIQRSRSAWYLIQGKYLNWQAVSELETHYGRQDPRLAPVLYQIVLEHFYQSVLNERRGMTSYELKSDENTPANSWMFSRNESVQRSYRIGRENLQRIRELYQPIQDIPNSTDALLQIYQADWEFLHGNNRVALALYQNAYHELLAAGIAEAEVDGYFNQLTKLPAQSLQTEWLKPRAKDNESTVEFFAWSALYPGAEAPAEFLQPPFQVFSDDSQRAEVELKLEVTGDPASGNFNYEIADLNIKYVVPDGEEMTDKVLIEVPLIKFRPRLVAGELANHEPFLVSYQFARQQGDTAE
ncbi:MAG: hypothetical protein KJO91_12140 [Gammaproteobacteria bacterium]|nr:hypothetical protein [Gammaproteobacteria bacterium]